MSLWRKGNEQGPDEELSETSNQANVYILSELVLYFRLKNRTKLKEKTSGM